MYVKNSMLCKKQKHHVTSYKFIDAQNVYQFVLVIVLNFCDLYSVLLFTNYLLERKEIFRYIISQSTIATYTNNKREMLNDYSLQTR